MSDILDANAVIPSLKVGSKKQALQELSAKAAEATGLPARRIFDVLLERERLGSTGMGRGIAIPHGKLAGLDRVHGLFARLERPVEFDAIDGQPVDLMMVLLAPEQHGADHLRALARVSRLLRNEALANKLRGCETADAMVALMADHGGGTAVAA